MIDEAVGSPLPALRTLAGTCLACQSSRDGVLLADESGQSLIETALSLPLLLLLLLAIIQCGYLFNNWVMLTDAVRMGARQLSTSTLPGQNACQLAEAATRASAPKLNDSSLIVTSVVTSSCTHLAPGSDATLTATYPCQLSILGINYAPSCLLRAQTTERVDPWTSSALPVNQDPRNTRLLFDVAFALATDPRPMEGTDDARPRRILTRIQSRRYEAFSRIVTRDRADHDPGVVRNPGRL